MRKIERADRNMSPKRAGRRCWRNIKISIQREGIALFNSYTSPAESIATCFAGERS